MLPFEITKEELDKEQEDIMKKVYTVVKNDEECKTTLRFESKESAKKIIDGLCAEEIDFEFSNYEGDYYEITLYSIYR